MMEIEGADNGAAIAERLMAIAAGYRGAIASALTEEAEDLMSASAPLVPVDEGVLRSSGHVEPPVDDGDQISVTCGYGGAADQYAIVQHERLDLKHTVGQAKYLEQPFNERSSGVADRVAAKVKDRMGA